MNSPFHPGERTLRERLDVRDQVEAKGSRMIRDHMPEQHRLFFAQLLWLLVGSLAALTPGRWRLRRSRQPLDFSPARPSPFLPQGH
ncbi:hypothetical protein [Pseudomonas sp. Q1-7]|uniref:hypothetical protein n=1 Tax=Pseudomonas sp. Q1-7 TaxID=3020843 RepID=UPI0023009572|nr:hypothetical protein [Pseudomonas sp. Q1-7]